MYQKGAKRLSTRKFTVDSAVAMIFNPISPIIILVVDFFLNLFLTGNIDGLHPFLLVFVKHRWYIGLLLVLWLLVSCGYSAMKADLDFARENAKELDSALKRKDNQIDQSASIISNKYGEFAEFCKTIQFNKVLQGFVENNKEIDSAQLYTYSLKQDKNQVIIKINFENGYVYEGVDINSILQSYYVLPKDIYNDFKNLILRWKELNMSNLSVISRRESSDKFAKEIMTLYDKCIKNINKLTKKEYIKNEHHNVYMVVQMQRFLLRYLKFQVICK